MAFIADIKYAPLADPSTFQLTDDSQYQAPDDQSNFTARSLIILRSDNTPLPGYTNPIDFPFSAGNTIVIAGLTQDWSLQVQMVLTPIVVNPGSVYVAEADFATNQFLFQGLYNIQVERLNNINPATLSDKVYRTNSIDLIIEMSNSQIAEQYSNFTGAQYAIQRGLNIIANTQL